MNEVLRKKIESVCIEQQLKYCTVSLETKQGVTECIKTIVSTTGVLFIGVYQNACVSGVFLRLGIWINLVSILNILYLWHQYKFDFVYLQWIHYRCIYFLNMTYRCKEFFFSQRKTSNHIIKIWFTIKW